MLYHHMDGITGGFGGYMNTGCQVEHLFLEKISIYDTVQAEEREEKL